VADPAFIVLVSLAFLAAGIVKGIAGMGLPAVAMGVLGLGMAPAAAAALLVVPGLVTNIWQLAAGRAFRQLVRRFGTMLLGVAAGTFVTIDILTQGSATVTGAALGTVIAAYGLVGLLAPRFALRRRAEPWLSPVVGVLTGLVSGATGLSFLPAVPYLSSLDLDKDDLIQALGLFFLVSTIALAAALAVSGRFPSTLALTSLLAVVPAIVGMRLGIRIRSTLPPEVFRRLLFAAMVLLGIYTVVRALT
jgi:uncharacterized membrane protein YfcA